MLESENIILRALEVSDVDKLFIWENDRDNWKVSHTITPYSKHVLAEYVSTVSDIYTDKQLRMVIEDRASGLAIGTVDLFDCDFKNKKAGIGILIGDVEKRGRGLASEAMELILPYCFEVLALHQVYCNILADNTESLQLFDKFGFKKIGLKPEWVYADGKFSDEWLLHKINPNEEK